MEAQPIVREVQDLTPLIQDVVKLRQLYALESKVLADLRAAWEAEHATRIEMTKERRAELEAAENSLRGEVLANYAATGDKQVAPGVIIRVIHKPIYDTKAAAEWSMAHGGIAHVFDAKMFEKLAQAGQASDIVEIEDIATATLAKDLGVAQEKP